MAMTQQQREQLLALRGTMDAAVAAAAGTAAQLNAVAAFVRPWKPGVYALGDVRACGAVPYRCAQAHDSTANPGWTPEAAPALWTPYHGTSRETARPWVAPTGAHDQYLAGEWMLYTDGALYECVEDTAFSPEEVGAAWRREE